MDSKDRQIIRALQANARMTNQDLAAAVNLSPSPCLRRLRNLEDSGVIRGYSVDVDARAYGLPMTVFHPHPARAAHGQPYPGVRGPHQGDR